MSALAQTATVVSSPPISAPCDVTLQKQNSVKLLPSFRPNAAQPSRNLVVPPHPLSEGLPPIYTTPSVDVMHDIVNSVSVDCCDPNSENAFFVCDLSRVWDQVSFWKRELGADAFPEIQSGRGVEAFFAVKCNPDPVLICLLASLGLGFDCASHGEIALVLSLGIDPSRIIYANPVKTNSFIRYAAAHDVNMMTFDNVDELDKIKKHHAKARLVLRLAVDDEGSLCRFSSKFGAQMDNVVDLLGHAKELDLDIIGVSFHVGSGCANVQLYDKALESVRWTFNRARDMGFHFDFVDIGGGFEHHNFAEIAQVVRGSLRKRFIEDGLNDIRVIAEPGRFFAAHAFELATNIIGRRVNNGFSPEESVDGEETPKVMYYINDGAYGAFNCTIFDHQIVHPSILRRENENDYIAEQKGAEPETCSVWGPTCDSIDRICSCTTLPRLETGDWLRWPCMGAYTSCAASTFNGFKRSAVHYTMGRGLVAGSVAGEIKYHLDHGLASGLEVSSKRQALT